MPRKHLESLWAEIAKLEDQRPRRLDTPKQREYKARQRDARIQALRLEVERHLKEHPEDSLPTGGVGQFKAYEDLQRQRNVQAFGRAVRDLIDNKRATNRGALV